MASGDYFLRPLDEAEQRKLVPTPQQTPSLGAVCLLIFPNTTTRRERGRNSGEAPRNNNNDKSWYWWSAFCIPAPVLSITHTLTDLMSSKMLFQQGLWTNPSRRKRKMSRSMSHRKHPLLGTRSDLRWKSSRAPWSKQPEPMPSASSWSVVGAWITWTIS